MLAPAKINLFLTITGQRPDGYHELENVFLPIPDLADTVTLTPLPDGPCTLAIDSPFPLAVTPDNLCLKAAAAFAAATHTTPHAAIRLVKRIPVAAGLGGGSSDAAATLLLLDQLCQTRLGPRGLLPIAAALGADVPYFLSPALALGTGIGDRLTPLPVKGSLTVLLANPRFPVTAAWAYRHLTLPPPDAPSLDDFRAALATSQPSAIARCCRNDLEHAILHKFPLLTLMRDHLLANGALCAHVSGSGPTLFAILPPETATATAASFANAFPNFPSPTIHTVTLNQNITAP